MVPTTFLYFNSPPLSRVLTFNSSLPSISFKIHFHSSSLSKLNTMKSILQTFHKEKSLPLSHNKTIHDPSPALSGMRRRLSFNDIQTPTISNTTAWALRSSKSVSSIGHSASSSVRNWWDRCWEWILSRKPVFAQDLEMNTEETSVLGCHNKGSWRHVIYKFRSEIRKLVGSDQPGLPQTIRSV